MGRIYSGSILNIAASSAVDSSHGLFKNRSPNLLSPLIVDIPEYGTWVLHIPANELSRSILKGPLSSRAWVLQEWILSPRVLHFGEQLFWECSEALSSESIPNGNYESLGLAESRNSFMISKVSWLRHDPEYVHPRFRHFSLTWRDICEEYSARNLTVSSDKVVAFSGIVDLFNLHHTDTHMAGIWKSTMTSDLCWYCQHIGLDPDIRKRSSSSARPPEYDLPSWSWMSVDHEICYPYHSNSREIAVSRIFDRSLLYGEPGVQECRRIIASGILRRAKWRFAGQDKIGRAKY